MQARALDNNVIGLVAGYFTNPAHPHLETIARDCFMRYVDGYIAARDRVAVMPGSDIGDVSAFFRLWQTGAEHRIQGPVTVTPEATALIWEQFLRAVQQNLDGWMNWFRYQWGPEITRDYHALILNWRRGLQTTLEFTRTKTTQLASDKNPTITQMMAALETSLGQIPIDLTYREEILRQHTDPIQYAIAYSFNMFQRGAYYREQSHGIAVTFHPLRDAAVAMRATDEGDIEETPDEVHWGEILDACIREELIPRDHDVFADVLRSFRQSVQTGQAYEARLQEVHATKDIQRKHRALDDAILAVFLDHNLPPALRSTTARAKVLSILRTIKETNNGLNRLIGPVLYEAGKLALDSNFLRLVNVEWRRRRNRESLWKIYRIPGRN